jgi:hypothetical protein
MTMINPIDHEEAYDAVILGGKRSPGVVTITGHNHKVGWDIKTAKGQAGASMSRKSEEPVPFTCTFFLADREDRDAWPAFLGLINSTISGPEPKALDIYHPDLVEQGITSVVKAETQGTKHDGKGGQIKVVQLIQYRPPKKSGGSPKGSKAKPKNDPNAAAKAELERLLNEYQRTPWG